MEPTVFLGDDVDLQRSDDVRLDLPAGAGLILRPAAEHRSGRATIGTTLTTVEGESRPCSAASGLSRAGLAVFRYLFDGSDSLGFEAPASLGALGQSPLIETYDDDDVIDGSLHADRP